MSSPSTVLTSSTSRSQIKKSMSDRSGKSPDSASSSPTHHHHHLSTSPKFPLSASSSSRTLSHSDQNVETTAKKSSPLSFHLFDSILQRSLNKPLTINTNQETSKKHLPSPSGQVQMPEQARCLHNYNAIKEDEICVEKGEFVQIVAANQDNRWFVHRDATRTSPAAEGWIPGFVLGLKHPNSISPTLSTNTLQRLSTTTSTHPTITHESTLPPKPQTNTCDKV